MNLILAYCSNKKFATTSTVRRSFLTLRHLHLTSSRHDVISLLYVQPSCAFVATGLLNEMLLGAKCNLRKMLYFLGTILIISFPINSFGHFSENADEKITNYFGINHRFKSGKNDSIDLLCFGIRWEAC